jgi:A/G-specific adenine glycosylase
MGKFLVALRNLENWFTLQKRVLPWRESPTLYRVWVSEIMLQQTQVVTVVPYFERWTERFPTVEALASAESDEVLRFWAGLGYYSRARNLHRGAQKIVEQGHFPQSRAEWLEIPGVGNYTAGAILSIASNQPEAILDGNVERVISRVRRVSRQKGDSEFKSRLWRLSKIFVVSANQNNIAPSILNQSLMELGATLCTPKKPKCSVCPLSGLCRAHQYQEQELYPPKKKPKSWVHLEENSLALVNEQGSILLSLHARKRWRAGLWDFPSRPPQEWINGSTRLGQIETQYVVTRHKVKRLTEVRRVSGPPSESTWKVAATEGDEQFRWIAPGSGDLPLGAPAKKVLQKVIEMVAVCD